MTTRPWSEIQHKARPEEQEIVLDPDEVCHIYLDEQSTYCGRGGWDGPPTCDYYRGEAICPTCGQPTCPRCAQLSDLEDRALA